MNFRITCFLLWLSLPFLTHAQQDYFQQEVNIKIEVSLDDGAHALTGTVEMEYINHSPDALNEIYLHLWANAYKNRKTAFAKQKLRTGSTEFYFSKDKDSGNFSELDFKVDGKTAAWDYDKGNPDIALLKLNKPLPPESKIIISSPFKLKIPASFSRLGHVGQSYQMTQWYPKPAVYDKDGWHPMPYLDMGEFYSEFGNFDVKITLPDNYVVGATGEVQNESEKAFLLKRAETTAKFLNETDSIPATNTFPPSSTIMKTLHYKAEQVHDFAWFADKRFYVQKSEVTLASGRKVDTWTMFTNAEAELWKKSIEYVDRSVKFYSEKVGEYPYPQASAVQSALSAGGGMEYPMITVIGLSGDAQSLDGVITHEVGHNWFYGILAFDERDHAWLDEGLNSYYDHRYNDLYYESAGVMFLPEFLMAGSDLDMLELAYLFQARRDLDQAPETISDDFSNLINYFLGAYEKPARFFKYLEMYLGTGEFDRISQGFYQKWKFKHPQPEDFRAYFEKECDKNLDWLFDGMINSNEKIDYAIKGLKKENEYILDIKNKGKIAGPFPLSGMKNGEILNTQWYDGFLERQEVAFPDGDYDMIVLDQQGYSLDIDRKNNNIKTSGAFKTIEPFRFKLLTGIENSKKTTIYWIPTVSWNNYDQFMMGLAFYNTTLPANKFEFAIAPMFGFHSKDLIGLGNFKYHLFPESNALQRVTFDLGLKSFNYGFNSREGYHLKYQRITPSLKFEFGKKKANSNLHQNIEFRSNFIVEEFAESDSIFYTGNTTENSLIHQVIYTAENRRALNPYSFKILLEQQSYEYNGTDQSYLKTSLEWNTAYTYNTGKSIDFRFFGGAFIKNPARNRGAVSAPGLGIRGSYGLAAGGFNDYVYDQLYFGRTEQDGFWSRQISIDQGGFKNAFGGTRSTGQSNNFIIAFNIKADLPKDLPLKLPLKPYFDWGYWDNAMPSADGASFKDQVMWSGGVMLDFFDGIFGVYFPIVNSDNIKSNYGDGNYGTRISFNLDLNKANPWRLVDRIEF